MARRLLCAIAAASLILAGCGSKAKGGTGSSAPVKFMMITTVHGPGLNFTQLFDGAKAAAARINAKGGLSGHKIEIETCDDEFDPNKATACGRKAVEDKVAAVLGLFSIRAGAQVTQVLQAGNIPSIGGIMLNPAEALSSIAYPYDCGAICGGPGPAFGLVKQGCKRIGSVLDQSNPAVNLLQAEIKAVTEGNGATYVGNVGEPTNAADPAPVVRAIMAKNPDCVDFVGGQADAVKFFKQLNSTNPDVKIGTGYATMIPQLLPSLPTGVKSEIVSVHTLIPPNAETTPPAALQQFAADMAAYAPKSPIDAFSEQGWGAMHLVELIAGSGMSTIDSTTMLAKLKTVHNLDIGIVPPISFDQNGPVAKYPHLFNATAIALKVVDNAYQVADPAWLNVAPYVQ